MAEPHFTNHPRANKGIHDTASSDLSDRAYKLAYKACRERLYERLPTVDELLVRVLGYARKVHGYADYQQVRDACSQALARIQQRAPLTWDGFIAWCSRRGRRSGQVRRAKTADRDAGICRDRAAGVSAIELAKQHGLSRMQIYRIAERDSGVTRTISLPNPDDIRNSDLIFESSCQLLRDGSGYTHADDTSWITTVWEQEVGGEPAGWQLHQLRAWTATDGGCDIVDLVRFIEYAGRPEIRDPFRYVQVAVERRRGKGPEYRQELEAAAGETGRRYADYGHVRNRRAYLATCARNADPPVVDAGTRRTGFLDRYRRRHGRWPWEPDGNGSSGAGVNAAVAGRRRHQQPEEALEPSQEPRSLPREKAPPVSEHGPCLHPLATLLTSWMSLADVVQVECSSGCGHRLYSDRGPFPCPCHWSPAQVARASVALRIAKGWSV